MKHGEHSTLLDARTCMHPIARDSSCTVITELQKLSRLNIKYDVNKTTREIKSDSKEHLKNVTKKCLQEELRGYKFI